MLRPEGNHVGIDTRPVLLRLSHISKAFGAVVALKDVALEVGGGEVHALLGENGAGKSTLMGIASGSIPPDVGMVEIVGQEVGELTPALARRRGLAIVHQEPALLPDLTVAENMRIAIAERLPAKGRAATNWMKDQLERVGSAVGLNTRVEELSVAERHFVEIANALALEPRVLVLDEPTAPLGADRIARLFEEIRAAAARGTAVIYITHRLAEVRQIADRVTVLRDGVVRGSSLVEAISDDDILRVIVGGRVAMGFSPKAWFPDG